MYIRSQLLYVTNLLWCRDNENKYRKKAAASAVLTEDESQRAYQHKRKRYTPPSTKVKSHSPDFSNISWNKEEVLHDLQQHPVSPTDQLAAICQRSQCSRFKRRSNSKRVCSKSGIDTIKLYGQCTDQPRSRVKKRS